MKTAENIEVVRALPLSSLQLETDGPWCEIRPSHSSYPYAFPPSYPPRFKAVKKERFTTEAMVKGRNEPCSIVHVARAVAGIKGLAVEEVAGWAWRNSVEMFGFGEGNGDEVEK